jgi:hypothetical protein
LESLSQAEKNAVAMGDMMLKHVIDTYAMHNSNPQVIAAALKFLTNLCYHKAVSDKVPDITHNETNIVGATLGIMNKHNTDPAVLVRGCKALQNMACASNPVRDFMKKEGCIQAMKDLIAQNAARDDVKRAAQAVLDALNRSEVDLDSKFLDLRPRLDMKRDAKSIFGKEEKIPVKHLSKDIRNFLQAGALLTKHSKTAAPRQRHVYVDNELKYLIWKDPKEKLKEENMMKVGRIKSVERGRCTPQLQRKALMGKFLAKEECAFAITGRERTVDLEAESEAAREKWVHAIETLIEYKKSLKLAATGF